MTRDDDREVSTVDDAHFLAAKKSVDDRALNHDVLTEVRGLAPYSRIVEVGAGLGTMVARLLEWQVIEAGEYTLLDVDADLLRESCGWLGDWAAAHGLHYESRDDGAQVGELRVRLVHAELGDYLELGPHHVADLLIANAVLDLVEVPKVLPGLLRLVAPGGAYWFTINYDGETVFEPEHPLDDMILGAYHQDMDERVRYGRPAGESRTGRRLFGHLAEAGAPPLAAGSSDWVVYPSAEGSYPYDEAYFVGRILTTIQGALEPRPDRVPPGVLAAWLAERRRQLAHGELVYIAHQLDFVGRPSPE